MTSIRCPECDRRDQALARLEIERDAWRAEAAHREAERDRLVAGCRATADWLEGMLIKRHHSPRDSTLVEVKAVEVSDRADELRRLFLPPVRYGDADPAMAGRYGQEEF